MLATEDSVLNDYTATAIPFHKVYTKPNNYLAI